MGKTIRTYGELVTLRTFEERFRYLMFSAKVGDETFGFERYLNQAFYKSQEWQEVRNYVIVRDKGLDLGVEGRPIHGRILVHHLNPITPEDVKEHSRFLLNPEYLISTCHTTHNAIHFGDESVLFVEPIVRAPGDTNLW